MSTPQMIASSTPSAAAKPPGKKVLLASLPSVPQEILASNAHHASEDAYATAPINGPTNRSWEPPPRAKPGRKPMNDNPIDKRKTQNRASQRAFRERKAEQIKKAETDVQELRRINATLEQRSRALAQRCTALEEEPVRLQMLLAEKEREADSLRQELKVARERLACVVGPRDDSTRSFDRGRISLSGGLGQDTLMPLTHSPPVSPPASLSISGGCGKCDDSGHCPCVDDYIQDASAPKASKAPSPSSCPRPPTPVDFTTMGMTGNAGRNIAANPPGTCGRCQIDPNQKRWCMTLARESRQTLDQTQTRSGTSSTQPKRKSERQRSRIPGGGNGDDRKYIQCSEAYPILKQSGKGSTELQDSAWMRTVMTRPNTNAEAGGHSALEVEMASALTALSRNGSG